MSTENTVLSLSITRLAHIWNRALHQIHTIAGVESGEVELPGKRAGDRSRQLETTMIVSLVHEPVVLPNRRRGPKSGGLEQARSKADCSMCLAHRPYLCGEGPKETTSTQPERSGVPELNVGRDLDENTRTQLELNSCPGCLRGLRKNKPCSSRRVLRRITPKCECKVASHSTFLCGGSRSKGRHLAATAPLANKELTPQASRNWLA